MTIGEKIKYLRKQKDMSQDYLSNELGESSQSIKLWENDQSDPSIDNLLRICKLFNVTMDELCGNDDICKEDESKYICSIGHSLTIYDQQIYKNILKILYKKYFIHCLIMIILSFLIFIQIIVGDINNVYSIIPFIIFILFIIRYIILKYNLNNQVDVAIRTEKNRKIEYWFYNDYIDLLHTTDNSISKYKKRYNEIKSVLDYDDYLYITFDGKMFPIDKNKIGHNLQKIISLFKNNSLKYKSSFHYVENTPLLMEYKRAKQYNSILMFLFVASLLSLFLGLFLVVFTSELLNEAPDISIMVQNMWKFYLVLPIPLSSLLFGLYCKKKGLKAKKNIVVGIIFTILLIIYGSFTFMDFEMQDTEHNLIQDIQLEIKQNGEFFDA